MKIFYTILGLLFSIALIAQQDADVPTKDQVINDDLIVKSSLAVGMDAVNGESFGFSTVLLKENNLRIRFFDTSNSSSFPSNDWELVANDSQNGGLNHFSIYDVTGGRQPLTVEAGAPTNSLYIESSGELGLGTDQPVVEIHTKDGDTPTLRLEQDGSSGWTPQTWDVAGNESGFFVRDATNGSTLPFRIQPSAPSSSLFIASDGDVGMGTNTPDGLLDIAHPADANNHALLIAPNGYVGVNIDNSFVPQNTLDVNGIVSVSDKVGIGTTTPSVDLEVKSSDHTKVLLIGSGDVFPQYALSRINAINKTNRTWVATIGAAGQYVLQDATSVINPFIIEANAVANSFYIKAGGNVGIGTKTPQSKLAVNGKITCKEIEVIATGWPDYVFAKDYDLKPLNEVEAFINENQHLPGVPSEREVLEDGVNLGEMNAILLEKIEELTLYMIDLKKENEEIKNQLKELER